jgi:hypothetical protein
MSEPATPAPTPAPGTRPAAGGGRPIRHGPYPELTWQAILVGYDNLSGKSRETTFYGRVNRAGCARRVRRD